MTPDRIVEHENGYTKRSQVTDEGDFDICFFRPDGFSVACPRRYEDVTYKSWADTWFAFYEPGTGKVLPIAQYKPVEKPKTVADYCIAKKAKKLAKKAAELEKLNAKAKAKSALSSALLAGDTAKSD